MNETSWEDAGPSPDVITYWRKHLPVQNFGDYLSELILRELWQPAPVIDTATRRFGRLHLIGSVISPWHILDDLASIESTGGQPVIGFWGCGMRRNEIIEDHLKRSCVFMGVRGPLTRQNLSLPADTPLGDPGLLMPLIYRTKTAPAYANRTVCMPHFLDTRSNDELLEQTKADLILTPSIVPTRHAVLETIDAIASCAFILTGSLHGAIVAAAYKVPFAFLGPDNVDAPFKWADLAALLRIPNAAVGTVHAGRHLHSSTIRRSIQMPSLHRLLKCAPVAPSQELLERAQIIDEENCS
jgi:hypothetical protein